jgi:mRNA interferase RelE/StbE
LKNVNWKKPLSGRNVPKPRYKILFQKTAYKEYQALPKAVKLRIDQALEMLSIDPLSEVLRFKKIRGKENHYRIRLGDYRIIYSPQAATLIVRVIRIGHRRDVYRHF